MTDAVQTPIARTVAGKTSRSVSHSLGTERLVSWALLAAGTIVQMLSYGTIQPFLVGLVFYATGVALLRIGLPGKQEEAAFRLAFAVCWVAAGIAAIYANQLGDFYQNFSDASSFFAMSTRSASEVSLEQIRLLTEGSGAVAVWRALYDGFHALGFEKGRFIGVATNVFLVALSGSAGVGVVRAIFGDAESWRIRRFTRLFASCGILWLFAAIHLRDASVLFCVSLATLFWARYCVEPSWSRLITVSIATLLLSAALTYLRQEFVAVPLALAFAAATATSITRSGQYRRSSAIAALFVLAVAVAIVFVTRGTDLARDVSLDQQAYTTTAVRGAQSDGSSLGLQLLVNAPLALRLVAGPLSVLLLPIPIWSGFQLSSAYALFKACDAIFMYFVIPLIALGLLQARPTAGRRTAGVWFLLFTVLGTLLAVAATSLESRHFGAFSVALLSLAVLADLRTPRARKQYQTLLIGMLACVVLGHVLWGVLKFV